MEKINNSTCLLPKIKTTDPTQLVVDRDDLDKLSNQLKLLKIDDFTINKILQKFKTVKKEVKLEPQECQVLEPQQQQPFVGYDGLFELAISQVIQCGYGHVLPSNIFGTKKRQLFNIKFNQTKQQMSNIDKRLQIENAKIMSEQYKVFNKLASSRRAVYFNDDFMPQECQVLEPQQQQPFVGYDGLFELAISQVIACGYGHVLPSNLFETKNSTSINTIKLKTKTCFKKKSDIETLKFKLILEEQKTKLQKLKLLQTMVKKDMINKENMNDLFKVLSNKH
uniref:Uncharacterized protein n=1 Tax=Meloidogyne enterolobii TaxID=390850 RepID=A0A6V7UX58_MELEN|nr:unnamed protein product [Meloidogyne enterolobii]